MVPPPRFATLAEWLAWQETLHPSSIDLGLERVATVATRLDCGQPAPLVITIGGTNGKGSCQAMLDAILRRAGYRVGCYSSPHLIHYNERVRLDGEPVSDDLLCEAFDRVDRAREEQTLTYFEFGTLAALDIMHRARLDVALLEVGLGGRLDAVNIVDADAALVSSIGLDHTDWLGPDRESIGREKAGIFRSGRPAVCGDARPPASLRREAERLGALLRVLGEHFRVREAGHKWHWEGEQCSYHDLPRPALPGTHQLANAASVLMLLEMLARRLPVSRSHIDAGLKWVSLPGRIQMLPGRVEQVLDVSHNAQAATALVDTLRHSPVAGATHAVIGMMRDKDIAAFVEVLGTVVSYWYPVGLRVARAAQASKLAGCISEVSGHAPVSGFPSVADAVTVLRSRLGPGDRILVCGSFHTVAEWLALNPKFE